MLFTRIYLFNTIYGNKCSYMYKEISIKLHYIIKSNKSPAFIWALFYVWHIARLMRGLSDYVIIVIGGYHIYSHGKQLILFSKKQTTNTNCSTISSCPYIKLWTMKDRCNNIPHTKRFRYLQEGVGRRISLYMYVRVFWNSLF